jgi:hypothetical protein
MLTKDGMPRPDDPFPKATPTRASSSPSRVDARARRRGPLLSAPTVEAPSHAAAGRIVEPSVVLYYRVPLC